MGCFTSLREMHLLKGALTSKGCITPFQGNPSKCLNMCLLKGLSQQCEYQNQFYIFIGCLCFCTCSTQFLKNYINRQNCLVPSPPSFLQSYLHFAIFFRRFSNGTTGPKEPTRSTKSKFATPKVGELAKSEVKVLHFCVVLPALQKTSNEPENQKTKKPRNPKNKKNKTILHTPRGRVVAESWVLSFCFFCFFGFSFFFGLWFRLANAEKPTTNQKTRKQETNKLVNQKTKKQKTKKQQTKKAKKTRLHTPRGE